jgi:hypothetical protein
MTKRSWFSLGFDGQPWAGMPSGIPVHNLTREQVNADKSILTQKFTPPGTVAGFPYIVKINGVGEYVVRADGTASFYSYKYHRWEPSEDIDTQSLWAKMSRS